MSRTPAEQPAHSLEIRRQPFSHESISTRLLALREESVPASLPLSPDSPPPPTVVVSCQLARQHNGSLWAAVLRGAGWTALGGAVTFRGLVGGVTVLKAAVR